MTETVIVLDFETTGLSPKQGARPTEVAAVVLESKMTGRYHRAEADAEITAKLWVEMKNEIKRCCRIDLVPIDLMEHIQKVPCRSMKRHVHRYFRVRS